MKGITWSKRDEQTLRRLYAQGVSDDEIARRLNRTKISVRSRRKVLGCVADRKWHPEQIERAKALQGTQTAEQIAIELGKSLSGVYQLFKRLGLAKPQRSQAEREALERFVARQHAKQWSDSEIAEAWSAKHPERTVTREWVMEVRRDKLGLQANGSTADRYRRRVAAKTQEQLAKAGLPSIGHLRVEAYKAFCVRQGWPQVERPRLAQILNVLYEQGPKTQPELAAAIGMRWRSSKYHPNGVGLTGNVQGGSYTGELQKMGLVVRLGRKARYASGNGKTRFIYAIAPGVVRGPIEERKVS